MASLFRPEAVKSHRHRLLGDVIIAQPLSLAMLTAFLALAVLAIAILVSQGAYARKVTVSGFLSPDKGMVRVHAPRQGVIGGIHVDEGAHVAHGTSLVTLLGERRTSDGIHVDEEMLQSIDLQIHGIDERRALDLKLIEAQSKRLMAEQSGLEAEASAIDSQLAVQRELVQQLTENNEQIRSLADRGLVSSEEFRDRKEKLLLAQQGLANLLQRKAANTTQSRIVTLALERLPLEFEQRQSELESLQADLEQRRTELEARRSITITAPVAGRVTALRAITGESADTTLPLLTILPDGGRLEAQLFVPTRAVGFIEVGQDVRLLYDAFDYRRYGVHAGLVTDISSSVFFPAETRSGASINEPTYRVTVRIHSQTVQAFGREFTLQAGMSLRADIVLEKRSLIAWLLDPLLALRGRT